MVQLMPVQCSQELLQSLSIMASMVHFPNYGDNQSLATIMAREVPHELIAHVN